MISKHFSVRSLCFAAMLLALGLILPQMFHMVGGRVGSSVLLPMHIPVLICGLLLGGSWGAIVGVFTPLLSSLIFAMPPVAILPFMMAELFAYGLSAGIFGRRMSLYPALFLAQLVGRIVYAFALFVGGTILGMSCAAPLSVIGSAVSGLPGLILQWILVPLLVKLLRRALPMSVRQTV